MNDDNTKPPQANDRHTVMAVDMGQLKTMVLGIVMEYFGDVLLRAPTTDTKPPRTPAPKPIPAPKKSSDILTRAAYNADETMELLGGIGRAHLYKLMNDGKLRSFKLGERRLFPADAIKELVDGNDPIE